jgi:uncharacterized protein (TIGR02594 family)
MFSKPSNIPAWMDVAYSYEGVKEFKGASHNPQVLDMFAMVGHKEIRNDETSWCAAFVGACLEKSGHTSTKSLLARSYLQWGKSVDNPQFGDVVVFWRGSKKSWQGHVAFYIKSDAKYVWVLGGNQRNAVNVSKYLKSQVLGYRRPSTMGSSRTVTGAIGTAAGGAIAQTMDLVRETQSTLMGMPVEWLKFVGVAIAVVSLGLVLYARYDDIRKKGR